MIWQPVSSKRLDIIRAPSDEPSLREMIGWLNDPVVMRYSEQRHYHHTIETQRKYISMYDEENFFLGLYHQGILLGTASIFTDPPNQTANVGIMIGERSMWRKGLGLEAWQAVCDKTLEKMRKVEAGCMACNVSMMSICSHYGMMEEGRQEDHFLINGQPTDLVHWGKFK